MLNILCAVLSIGCSPVSQDSLDNFSIINSKNTLTLVTVFHEYYPDSPAKKQSWNYSSHAECLQGLSRIANYKGDETTRFYINSHKYEDGVGNPKQIVRIIDSDVEINYEGIAFCGTIVPVKA